MSATLPRPEPSVLEANGHRSTLAIMNISYAADLWLGELERQGHSDRTVDTYRRLLNKLADDHARHIDIRDLSVTHLRKFLDRQARNRDGNRKSPATVAQNVSIVNGFFDWLTREGVIPRNPTRRNGDQDDRIIWRLVKDTAGRAGVTTHVHALRAAFAVHFLETHGGELVALQKLMGHKRIETTLVYLRRLDRQQQMETVRDLSWKDVGHGEGLDAGADSACGVVGDLSGVRQPQGFPDHGNDAAGWVPGDTDEPGLHEGADRAPADVAAGINQTAGIQLESNALTEKEGFEPSLAAKPHGERAGSENAADVPAKPTLNEGTPDEILDALGVKKTPDEMDAVPRQVRRGEAPSSHSDRSAQRPNQRREDAHPAPLDAALLEKVRAIKDRAAETAE